MRSRLLLGKPNVYVALRLRGSAQYVHFCATPAAANSWTAQHDGTFTISLTDEIEIARLTNRARYPSTLTP